MHSCCCRKRFDRTANRRERAAKHVPCVQLGDGEVLLPREADTEADFVHWGIQTYAYNVEALRAQGRLV
ncbi:MAG: hypothetical protein U0003_02885 [Vampirovibrionales bacterium]